MSKWQVFLGGIASATFVLARRGRRQRWPRAPALAQTVASSPLTSVTQALPGLSVVTGEIPGLSSMSSALPDLNSAPSQAPASSPAVRPVSAPNTKPHSGATVPRPNSNKPSSGRTSGPEHAERRHRHALPVSSLIGGRA